MRYNAYAVKVKRWRNKLAAIKYLGGKCKRCGLECEEDMIGVFSFHHRNPEEKDFGISSKYDRLSWEKIKKELDKCELVCNNCHGRIHAISQNDQQFLNDVFDYNGDLDIWMWGRKKKELQIRESRRCKRSKCSHCGAPIYERFKYCSQKCARLSSRKVDRPNKEDLEEMINTMSWLAIGKKYEVSDNAVRKWARSYGIL